MLLLAKGRAGMMLEELLAGFAIPSLTIAHGRRARGIARRMDESIGLVTLTAFKLIQIKNRATASGMFL
jgi:hypothetical protein